MLAHVMKVQSYDKIKDNFDKAWHEGTIFSTDIIVMIFQMKIYITKDLLMKKSNLKRNENDLKQIFRLKITTICLQIITLITKND